MSESEDTDLQIFHIANENQSNEDEFEKRKNDFFADLIPKINEILTHFQGGKIRDQYEFEGFKEEFFTELHKISEKSNENEFEGRKKELFTELTRKISELKRKINEILMDFQHEESNELFANIDRLCNKQLNEDEILKTQLFTELKRKISDIFLTWKIHDPCNFTNWIVKTILKRYYFFFSKVITFCDFGRLATKAAK
ncbi:hypothetical protein Glove_21g130 [Diversispora epigaea]|uniref:Uncharacterized protein n=1 Tax=Diversispora epigaea TaxID=1348612 RepID=A0A397JN52_9GLOM|nr:hypothetical protein Glove_21g130 [Diversispora epigaea]